MFIRTTFRGPKSALWQIWTPLYDDLLNSDIWLYEFNGRTTSNNYLWMQKRRRNEFHQSSELQHWMDSFANIIHLRGQRRLDRRIDRRQNAIHELSFPCRTSSMWKYGNDVWVDSSPNVGNVWTIDGGFRIVREKIRSGKQRRHSGRYYEKKWCPRILVTFPRVAYNNMCVIY